MNKFVFISIIAMVFSLFSFAQEKNDSIPKIELSTLIQVNQGSSYTTFPTDIGNIEPLWFEGNIVPNFVVRSREDSRLTGVLTPQIIIRMFQEESFPVRTPSYIPQITAYYLLSSKAETNSLSLFGRIAHHSNGQEGDFYLENGEINHLTGNFSTNYYELGFIKTNFSSKFNAVQFVSTSIQIHPENLTEPELIGLYSLYRWNTTFSLFKLPTKDLDQKRKANFSLKGQTTWMFGNINDWNNFSLNRLNLSLTFYYYPHFLEDIGLFTQIYHGSDYYNIYFDHEINMIRFGMMTNKLKF